MKYMNNLSAVFWDVDGTIADTELCGHRVAFNLAFKDFDLDWFWDEANYLELLEISGGLNRIIYYRDKIQSDITNDHCSKIQLRKRSHYKKIIQLGRINVRNGVLRLIKELADCNIEQFIVTTSGRESLDPFLNTSLYSHLKFFSQIITYEDVINHKPFPDAYILAKKLSKQPNENCIVIEDSCIGVDAAKAANLKCLMTLPPWLKSNNKINKKADSCVDSLGNTENKSKLVFGKPLISNIVDLAYLTQIIN